MASFDTYACSVCSKSFGESHSRCAQHVAARKGVCRSKGATVKRVPIIVGRNDRNVGGRRQLEQVEADVPASLPRAGSVSNLPVDTNSEDAGDGDLRLADAESDSGYISLYIYMISLYIYKRYPYISLYISIQYPYISIQYPYILVLIPDLV